MDRQLTQDGFTQVAKKFRLLGDPVRLKILDLLRREGQLSVGEITNRLECSQPNTSRQLTKLFEAKIVARRRDGNTVHYYIEDFTVFDICEAVCGRLEREAAGRLDSLYEPLQPKAGAQ